MTYIDSDILIDFLNNKKEAIEIISRIKGLRDAMATTSVNSFEIFCGISKLEKEKVVQVKEFLNNFRIDDFDFSASQKAAEIYRDLKSKGSMIDLGDIMIASIAIENEESLLTKNTRHFERIPGLKLEKL